MDKKRVDNSADEQTRDDLVFGRNAVLELLKSGAQVDKLFVKKGEREGSITTIVALALKAGVPVLEVETAKLNSMCGGVHQGVCAVGSAIKYVSVQDILDAAESKGEKPFIVIADGIEDPHNLGALLRCCECAGVHGLIIPKRRAAAVNSTVVKAAAGACAYVPVAKVPNLTAEIKNLKEHGVWIFCAEAGGDDCRKADFTGGIALVVGSEGTGVSRLVREACDFVVSIPMYGKINSLNVSCAAAVLLTEAARRRNEGKIDE